MVTVLVPEINNRLKFIFDFIFKQLLGTNVTLTDSEKVFLNSDGPRFSYGDKNIENEINFFGVNLLFEKELISYDPEVFDWNEEKVFFKVGDNSVLPFDPFASSFFLVTRYEEYFPSKLDKHGRFRPSCSISYRNDFLKKPIVDIYAKWIAEILLKKYPNYSFSKRKSNFKLTIDIDNAYAFKYKGVTRVFGSLGLKLMKFRWGAFLRQLSCHIGLTKDPYDSYSKIRKIALKYNLKPNVFFLLGDLGKYDRNLRYDSKAMKALVAKISKFATIGMHPSYKTFTSETQLKVEKSRIDGLVNEQTVIGSRQHYLRFRLPDHYRKLIKIGIKDEYSMGYASKIGFRAGTCSSFYFFDLENDQQTNLMIHPFFMMDTTLKQYLRISSAKALDYVKPLIEEIKRVNGEICVVFHNESIGGKGIWKRWGNFCEDIIKISIDK